MIKEFDCIALTCDLPGYGLAAGDVGAVVHVYKEGRGYLELVPNYLTTYY